MTDAAMAPAATQEIASTVDEAKTALAKVKVAGELDLLTAAKAFAASGMFNDVKTQAQAVVKIVAGYELGIKPFAAMRGIHFIGFERSDGTKVGVLELSAQLRAALVKKSGRYDYRIREHDDTHCRIEFYEKDPNGERFESVGFSEYGIEQAKLAGLDKPRGTKTSNWVLYPSDMCFAGAMRRGARRFCPDLFLGESLDDTDDTIRVVEDELTGAGIDVDIESDDIIDADVEEVATQPTDEPPTGDGGEQDGAREPEPAPADTDEEAEAVYIDWLPVTKAADFPRSAAGLDNAATKEQRGNLKRRIDKMGFTEGVLDPVCRHRFGVPWLQIDSDTAIELWEWLQAMEASHKSRQTAEAATPA